MPARVFVRLKRDLPYNSPEFSPRCCGSSPSPSWPVTPAAIAALSPYIRERVKRFGEYATDGLTDPPAAFDPHLDLHRPPTSDAAPTAQAARYRDETGSARELAESHVVVPYEHVMVPSRDVPVLIAQVWNAPEHADIVFVDYLQHGRLRPTKLVLQLDETTLEVALYAVDRGVANLDSLLVARMGFRAPYDLEGKTLAVAQACTAPANTPWPAPRAGWHMFGT
jgi:hypothetical protein